MHRIALALTAALLLTSAAYAESPNTVRNGSFEIETNTGIPDGWRIIWNFCRQGYFGEYQNATPKCWEETLGKERVPTWGVDPNVAHEGKKSLRIAHPASFIFATIHSGVSGGKLEKGKTYEFSFWMKADREGLPVQAGLYSKPYQAFLTTKEWKRHTLTVTAEEDRPDTMIVFRFSQVPVEDYAELCRKAEAGEVIDSPDAVATYWVDDVQMRAR